MGESQGATTEPFSYRAAVNGTTADNAVAIEALETFMMSWMNQPGRSEQHPREREPHGGSLRRADPAAMVMLMHGAQRNLVTLREKAR
jgi:hypothetical protein